jgi:hypothetical protein
VHACDLVVALQSGLNLSPALFDEPQQTKNNKHVILLVISSWDTGVVRLHPMQAV